MKVREYHGVAARGGMSSDSDNDSWQSSLTTLRTDIERHP